LLSLHHFQELLTHDNEDVAVSRARFLGALPFIAWVQHVDGSEGLGSAIDLLAAEAEAALADSSADILKVRDGAFVRVLQSRRAEDVVFDEPHVVLAFRDHLLADMSRTREVVALTRSKAFDASETRIDDLLKGHLRTRDDLDRHLGLMAGSLA